MSAADLQRAFGSRPRVAVIGSGVSGLTAAYVLRASHEVTLYEADDRLGGHADTHDITGAAGEALAVDTGFIVHNARTYPTLLRLFDELGVHTQETDMSMSVCCDGCGLEYSGGQGAGGIIAQPSRLLRPAFGRMLLEITRFHRHARATLAEPVDGSAGAELTMAQFLADGGYSPYFSRHFVTPLIAAVWSCGPRTALRYPARYLFAFLDNHGMLSVGGSPKWRTVVGGSRTYVQRCVKELAAVQLGTPVRSVTRQGDGDPVEVRDAGDRVAGFDAVVVATHPDQALRLLADATPAERAALGAFRYTANPAVLHTDPSVLPRARRARAAWNYRMPSCSGAAEHVQVSYDMTRLQRLPTRERYLVSLNIDGRVAPGRIVSTMGYAHPQYTPEFVAAQALLPALNDGVTAFAGAYHGWGFHEDGARSGLAAAESLGGRW
jgi:predicted NAD/FAD-binding protein